MEDPTSSAAMSAADEAAMDRRRKLDLWKAQKEAEKAAKSQVWHLFQTSEMSNSFISYFCRVQACECVAEME